MKKIDYSKLLPGMIIGTTKTLSFMGAFIRSTEAGFKKMFSPNVASHVLVVVEKCELFQGIEMRPPKISEIDLCDYENSLMGNHIVFIADPYANYNDGRRSEANRFIIQSHVKGIKYDTKGLFEFWNLLDDDPNKLYCSELVRQMLLTTDIQCPKEWADKVSPYEIQRHFEKSMIRWWK